MDEPLYIRAHKHSSRNWSEIQRSDSCGCFYCLAIFSPGDMKEWIDDVGYTGTSEVGGEGFTARCPKCPVDSVIGSASGYPITREFLSQMMDHWF